jgi:hypothetical protein
LPWATPAGPAQALERSAITRSEPRRGGDIEVGC